MPMTDNNENFLIKVINVTGASLYPLALGLLLPVFMYSIVLEKEERILEMMKMNGLRLNIYWTVNFIFDFTLYTITVVVFMLFGYIFLDLPFFEQTNIWIFVIIFIGWGISQISMAFLISVFISKSRTANIIGYLVSIWLILTAVSLNLGIYPYPKPFP